MPRQVLICFNPAAGNGKSKKILDDLLGYTKSQSINCAVFETSKDESVLKRALSGIDLMQFAAVIAIGGDGVVHQLLQLINGLDLGLYVIPAGTGNDFARTNRLLTVKPAEIFERIFESEAETIDLGVITYGAKKRFFGQILSTGFDALVNERANRNEYISGKMKYNLATAIELPSFQPIHYKIDVDGKSREFQAMVLAIANGPSYGGGMQLVPHADRKDGVLDIMILHPVSKIELIKVFPKVYKGSHVDHPAVEFLAARKVEIVANSISYADGERIANLPITVEVKSGALKTWTSN
jgi:diacylglycerol kinase (ATP)